MVFYDISKAFDRAWHRSLLAQLYHDGIIGNFDSYLSNRYQRETIPGGCSEWVENKTGVPQGSIIGPFLFLLYIDDTVH